MIYTHTHILCKHTHTFGLYTDLITHTESVEREREISRIRVSIPLPSLPSTCHTPSRTLESKERERKLGYTLKKRKDEIGIGNLANPTILPTNN